MKYWNTSCVFKAAIARTLTVIVQLTWYSVPCPRPIIQEAIVIIVRQAQT